MKVSEIMDNYIDNEFLIEGQGNVSTDEVLKGVLSKIKKPVKLKAKIVVIAAAVAILGVITAASLPGGFLTTKMGAEISWGEVVGSGAVGDPVLPYVIEEDRVYFIVDGLHEDITDYINSGEIYSYCFTDTDSAAVEHKGILMVKGPMDDIVFGEAYFDSDPSTGSDSYVKCGSLEREDGWMDEFYRCVQEYREQIIEEYRSEAEKNG
ncbi:MAG: hypothetical protein NC203_09280 [Firmicutes bacterium]|nr:hypothetical protein [[Eubacterium] siraeum]MCM1488545.1 hypothetical protein [Bacillota bacterium]